MVSIAAFQAVDPGSIPGRRNFFLSLPSQDTWHRFSPRTDVWESSKFSWCSGYHICLTHRRSPVRSRAKTAVPRGLTARISGFHPGGPGSTPGVGIPFSCPHTTSMNAGRGGRVVKALDC